MVCLVSFRKGNAPKALIVAYSDLRVFPALLTGAEPGDEFVVLNVANLVPPYEQGVGYSSIPAALEFGVRTIEVESIIVLGHARRGGINALMNSEVLGGQFIGKWVSIAQRVRERVLSKLPVNPPVM
jgi:carbonic anhydrase